MAFSSHCALLVLFKCQLANCSHNLNSKLYVCFILQEVRSQIPHSLVPAEYHIVKNPGVMGLEFQEE